MKSFNDLVKKITVLSESDASRDDRAEKAGRKVAHDIEYDERDKDHIHGKRRDSEDEKAERAGKKVARDIEYDELHEGHQVKKIVSGKNGGMIGEIGFDNDAPAGQGPFYMKHFSSGTQLGGFDSEQDAMNELQYYQNLKDKGYAESKVCEDDNTSDEVWLTAKNLESQYDLPISEFGVDELEVIADKFGLELSDVAEILELEYDDGEMSDEDATGMRDGFGPHDDGEMSDEEATGMRDALGEDSLQDQLRGASKQEIADYFNQLAGELMTQYGTPDRNIKKSDIPQLGRYMTQLALVGKSLKAIKQEAIKLVKGELDEVSKSQSQARMMAAAAHNPKFAKKVGVSQDVAKEFNRADTGKDISRLPQHVAESAEFKRFDRAVENMVAESISVNVSTSTGNPETGAQPMKSINVTADGADADVLAQLLSLAGVQSEQPEVEVVAEPEVVAAGPEGMVDLSQFDTPAEPCEVCGESACQCEETLEENEPDWPTNTETNDDPFQYSGGLNKPKAYRGSTGQTTRAIVGTVSMDESVELERSLWSLYKQVK